MAERINEGYLMDEIEQENKRTDKPKPKRLTVQALAKVKANERKRRIDKRRTSWFQVAMKWIFTAIVLALLLGSVTLSKISIVFLSENLEVNDESQVEKSARAFVMILFILLVPNVFNLLRGCYRAFGKRLPWPDWKTVLITIFLSILEAAGLTCFAYKLLYLAHGGHVIAVMNCVFLPDIFVNFGVCLFLRRWRDGHDKLRSEERKKLLVYFVATVVGIVGFVMTLVLYQELEGANGWHFFLSIVFLAVCWSPYTQRYLVYRYQKHSSLGSNPNYDNANINTDTNQENNSFRSKFEIFLKKAPSEQTPGWKIVIIMSFVRSLFVVGFAFVFFILDRHSTEFYGLSYNSTMDIVEDLSQGLNWANATHREIYYFVGNILGGLTGYFVGFLACTARMQALGFAVPLGMLSSPLATALITIPKTCHAVMSETTEICVNDSLYKVIIGVGCLVLAQALAIGFVIGFSKVIVMETEMQAFWIPTYNGVMLEQWLLLTKRNAFTDEHTSWYKKSLKSKVYMCTTMYREEEHEVRQVLESIEAINHAWVDSSETEKRHIESHIFFDGGVSATELNRFSLKLVALATETLDVKTANCKKTKTPYGMSLSWTLPGREEAGGITVTIHLKDNVKVKNKKRWSQIMYMSYVLDFLSEKDKKDPDVEAFILTTDADVQFTRTSVEALMDRVTRDPVVGAVCGRTHPIGHGPLAWYQVFEYAVGHWLQKASEDMIGTVLCAPGCFSIYRCKALKDVLPIYASNVQDAFDYLIKDMGEDRWLCTLMVEAGWRIEYCATSKCHTHCPTDFDEFFKQRRRWIGSSIANVMLFIMEWATIRRENHHIPFIFLLYQLASLVASFIGPCTVIIVVAGGMSFAWNFEVTATIALQLLICLGFGLACLKTSQETQLLIAKLLTFFYAIAMAAVFAATVKQIVVEVKDSNSTGHVENAVISPTYMPISTTTLYVAIICGIFVITGFLHITEVIILLHGIWYIFGFPAGFLVLVIYSISNITDRSWGTREAKSVDTVHGGGWKSIVNQMQSFFTTVCFCCPARVEQQEEGDMRQMEQTNFGQSVTWESPGPSTSGSECQPSEAKQRVTKDDDAEHDCPAQAMKIEDWLEPQFKDLYLGKFKEHGFDNTMFLRRITTDDLKNLIGITKKGHQESILKQIRQLPEFELLPSEPSNEEGFEKWLKTIGLLRYSNHFKEAKLNEAETLKDISTHEDVWTQLKIEKEGHVKQLLYAIRQLRTPTKGEEKLVAVKKRLEELTTNDLPADLEEFWENLIKHSLKPASKALGQEGELKELLVGLRNRWLVMFTVANVLWLIISLTIASQAELMVLGTSVAGLVFLAVFGVILIVQFLMMLLHRLETFVHYLARAPYRIGEKSMTWSVDRTDMTEEDMPEDVNIDWPEDDITEQ